MPSPTIQTAKTELSDPEASSPLQTHPSAWRNPRLGGRIIELDGIRGLAILLVLVWHCVMYVVVPPAGSWQARVLSPFQLTWSGVDLFFVLSGFLIGGILVDAKLFADYYKTFYLRRVHRIFPMYFILFALFLVGLSLMNAASPKPLINLFNHSIPAWSYPFFLQNIFMAVHSGFGPDWMGQTWSLAVEEQFYLLLPLAIRRLASKSVVRLTIGAVLFAPLLRTALWFVANSDKARYTLLPCRADALGIGVLIALACRDEEIWTWLSNHRRHLYAAFAVLGLGFCHLTWHYGGRLIGTVGYTWIAAFYGSLLLLVLVNPGRLERGLFRGRILVRLGTLAYAVYLFHEPINSLCHWLIFGSLPSIHSPATAVVTVLAFAASIMLAEISWRLIEKPLIRRAHAKYQYTTSSVRRDAVSAAVSA